MSARAPSLEKLLLRVMTELTGAAGTSGALATVVAVRGRDARGAIPAVAVGVFFLKDKQTCQGVRNNGDTFTVRDRFLPELERPVRIEVLQHSRGWCRSDGAERPQPRQQLFGQQHNMTS
jgi:hypothetical protein